MACHHLGGVGGAGGNDRNVLMLTAVASPTQNSGPARYSWASWRISIPGFGAASPVIHEHATG